MRLYHTTPAVRLSSIHRRGLDPAYSTGKESVVWLHSKCRTQWAEQHVIKRHQAQAVTTIELDIPRSWLTRRRRGLWSCNRLIPPERFEGLDKYIVSEMKESERIRRYLDGDDISNSPLWLAKGIPSFTGALELAVTYDIVPIGEGVKMVAQSNGMPAYVATVTSRRGTSTRQGAAVSQSPEIAKCLAYRNTVRQLIPQEGVKLTWRDKQSQAIRYV